MANRHPGVARTYYFSHWDCSIDIHSNIPLTIAMCSLHGQFLCRAVVNGLEHNVVTTNPVAGHGCKLYCQALVAADCFPFIHGTVTVSL